VIEAVRAAGGEAGHRALGAYFGDAEPVALEGDQLRLQFGPRQRLWLEYCDGPNRRALLETTVGRILGRRLRLRFEQAAGEASPDPMSAPTRTRALRAEVEAARQDPTVAAALKLFDGRIIDVQKPEKP